MAHQRHARNLIAWLKYWGAEVEAFTPPLADQIVPTVAVDDARWQAPLYGRTQRFQVLWTAKPAAVVAEHPTLKIKVRGRGFRLYGVSIDANQALRIKVESADIALTGETVQTPLQMAQPNLPGPATLESVFSIGNMAVTGNNETGLVALDAGEYIVRVLAGAAPSYFLPIPLEVPQGQNLYLVGNTANQTPGISVWGEEAPR